MPLYVLSSSDLTNVIQVILHTTLVCMANLTGFLKVKFVICKTNESKCTQFQL